MNDQPSRKQNRLSNFDYTTHGVYFVTVCTQNKRWQFWERGKSVKSLNDPLPLNSAGRIVENVLLELPNGYTGVSLCTYVVMPDHIHFLIQTDKDKAVNLSYFVRLFKTRVTKELNRQIWQRSFYDRIVRDAEEYQNFYNYIKLNPLRWLDDDLSPEDYLMI